MNVSVKSSVEHSLTDDIAHEALLGIGERQSRAQERILKLAKEQGVLPSSIFPVYAARARGEVQGCTVPAFNLRGLSYEFATAIIRAARANNVGLFIIEIARSEMGYSDQRPQDILIATLAATLREGFHGPLFLQGDHYQINPKQGIDNQVREIELLIDESLNAQFYNIDIDASTTVDLSKTTPDQQQANNAEITAHLTRYVRKYDAVTVSIGGEIGEIGGPVSTVEDLRAFMRVYRRGLGTMQGISKVAVQTGTKHGGIPNPDGSLTIPVVDFQALSSLSDVARKEFGLAGAVQHGASTLPDSVFPKFVRSGACEIHLSTEFQNIVFEHPVFPSELLEEMNAYITEHFSQSRVAGETDAQFLYRHRKQTWGPFKRHLAQLPREIRATIVSSLEHKVASLFRHLGVVNTQQLVDRYVS